MFEKTKINEKEAGTGQFRETNIKVNNSKTLIQDDNKKGSGVAQLVEQLLPPTEVCNSNPVIGKKCIFVYCQLY